jgi:hypothetical protein
MRSFLIEYFAERMKYLDWRGCFNLLLTFNASYEEQRTCETMFDEYHESKRIPQEAKK